MANKFHKWRILEEYEECTECGIKKRTYFNANMKTRSELGAARGYANVEYFIFGKWERSQKGVHEYCKSVKQLK